MKNNIRLNVYCKTDKKNDVIRFWASVPGTDKDDERIYASMFVRFSKSALKTFDNAAETTNTKNVTHAYIEVTDGWFKAIPGKEHNNIVFFINDFEVVEDDD